MIYGALIVVCIVFGLLGILILRFWFDRRDFEIRNQSDSYRQLDAELKMLLANCCHGQEIKREYRIVHHCLSREEFETFDAASCWQAYVISHHEFLSYLLDCFDQNYQRQCDMYRIGNRILPDILHSREYKLCQRLLIETAQSVICDAMFVLECRFDGYSTVSIYRKHNLQEQLDAYERGRTGCQEKPQV